MGEPDKNVKIDITATASGMEPGVTDATAKLDKLSRSTSKMASEYSGLDAATKKMTGSTVAYTADVNKLDGQLTALLQSINPAYAAMIKMDQGTDLLHQGLAHGLISNQQYASSMALLESRFASATVETGKAVTMTARARQEMMVLGREVASGNFSRIPGTLSIIAQGLSGGVLAGLGMVAAAATVGAIAWESYGGGVEKVRNELDQLDGDLALKTLAALNKRFEEYARLAKEKRAEASRGGWGWRQEAAEAAMYEEQMRKVGEEIDANRKKEERLGDVNGEASKLAAQASTYKIRELQREIGVLQVYHDKQKVGSHAEIDSLKRIQELKDQINKANGGGDVSKSAAFLAALQRESDTYGMTAGQIKIYEAAKKGIVGAEMQVVKALAEEIDAHNAAEKAAQKQAQVAIKAAQDHAKAVEQANAIIYNIDPIARATHEWEKLLALHEQGLLTDEQMGKAYANLMGKTEKTATGMSETWKTFADNTQRTLSDVLYNGMNGQFNNIEEMFKQMLFRMAANAASMRLTEGLFGTGKGGDLGLIGKLFSGSSTTGLAGMDQSMPIMAPSFAGGGYTGDGARTGGIDGKGGFPAILHPNEEVFDHTKGQAAGGGGQLVINDYTSIQVDSRSDRAQVITDVSGLIDQKHAQLVERLRREGAIA